MAGLVPAIHVFAHRRKTWMPGTRPGMTNLKFAACSNANPYAAACSRGW
jgi:hypothetical protein